MTPRRRAALADCTAQQFTCVLFDLDDTLFDSTGTLQAPALAKVVGSLAADPSCAFADEEEAHEAIHAFERSFGSRRNILEFLEELVSLGKLSQEGARAAAAAYNAGGGIDEIVLFADAAPMLRTLRAQGYRLGIITSGQRERQQHLQSFGDYLLLDVQLWGLMDLEGLVRLCPEAIRRRAIP